MDYINDSLRAKYITLEEYDNAKKINSKLNKGYFLTNEYLDYFNEIDFKNKNVLSVCCSGDQAFMSLIKNAASIDMFDINPLQYYLFYLKKAAIIGLEKEEYLKYFPLVGGNIYENYNIKYYLKFRDLLSDDVKYFWDHIYNFPLGHIYLLNKFSYLIHFESNYTRWYSLLKEKLINSNINYFDADFFNAYKLLNNNYDIILLSNIFDHIKLHRKYYESEYIDFIKENYFPLLNDNGICICHYQFLRQNYIPISKFKNTEIIKCAGADYVHVLKK